VDLVQILQRGTVALRVVKKEYLHSICIFELGLLYKELQLELQFGSNVQYVSYGVYLLAKKKSTWK
jgi:hypothetical protein